MSVDMAITRILKNTNYKKSASYTPENEAYISLVEAIAEQAGEDYITCWRDIKRYGDVMYVSSLDQDDKYESNIKLVLNTDLAGGTAQDHVWEIERWIKSVPIIKKPESVIAKLKAIAEADL